MVALTADKNIDEKEGKLVAHPIVAADIIFKGAFVKHNAAGFLAPCSAEAGAFFAGISYEQKDNSAGAAGDLSCRVLKKGRFLLTTTGMAQANVGDPVFASDDQTFSLVQGANEQQIGVIDEFVSATQVYVKIDASAV